MGETEAIDAQLDAKLRRAADDHSSRVGDIKGASITQIGVGEKTFIALIVAPLLVALVFAVWALHEATDARGQASLAANNAQLAERNAKLAQYQLEELLKRNHLEVPHE